jgi:hypothetical protein
MATICGYSVQKKSSMSNAAIYKKTDRIECINYRKITSLSMYRALFNILLSKLTQYLDKIIGVISVLF